MKLILPFCLAVFTVSACGEAPSDKTLPARAETTQAQPFESVGTNITPELAERFSALALTCLHKEFPNKISRTIGSADEVGRPKEIFPAFYGCFDWHSAVHGHWMLVRLLRVAPDGEWKKDARIQLGQSFSEENISGEIANFTRSTRGAWERPYGLAWFLQLTAELRRWDDPQAKLWLDRLEPLETDIANSLKDWLPKLAYPIRLGTHNQSAFAFGLMWDWAQISGDEDMVALIKERALAFHKDDINCPLAYEPSGEDFLSPCLMEADLMRRVLSQDAFSTWLGRFMPNIPSNGSADWLDPGIVKDASDGKLVHLDGVNLSRAWNLYNIAAALPENDSRRSALLASARRHEEIGLAAVTDEHYSGSHWLASFATYLTTSQAKHLLVNP